MIKKSDSKALSLATASILGQPPRYAWYCKDYSKFFALDFIAYCNHNATTISGDFAMPALTIKNIPDDLYNELKYVAEQHHRSINSEVIVCLKRTLFPQKITPEDRLNNIQSIRSQITPNIITAEDIEQAINEGRP